MDWQVKRLGQFAGYQHATLPGVQHDTTNTVSSLGERRGRRDTSAAISLTGQKSDVGWRPPLRTSPGPNPFREFLEERGVPLTVKIVRE